MVTKRRGYPRSFLKRGKKGAKPWKWHNPDKRASTISLKLWWHLLNKDAEQARK